MLNSVYSAFSPDAIRLPYIKAGYAPLTYTIYSHILQSMKDKSSITKQAYPIAMAYAFVIAALYILGSGLSFYSPSSTAHQEDTISQQTFITQPALGHELSGTDQWPDIDFSSAGAVHPPSGHFLRTYHLHNPTGERHATPLPVKRFILYSCLKLGDQTALV